MARLYAKLLIKYRLLVLLGAAAFTVLMISPMIPLENVRFDFSFRRLFRFEGEDAELLARFKDRFGDDAGAFGVLYVAADAVPGRAAALSPDIAASMRRIEAWVADRPEIEQAHSLSPLTATDFYSEPLLVAALKAHNDVLDRAETNPEEAAEAWAAPDLPDWLAEYGRTASSLMRHDLYRGMLLSSDGTAGATHFRFNMDHVHPSSRRGFLAAFDDVVKQEQERLGGRVTAHLFGVPVVTEEYTRLSIKDIVQTAPLSTGVMAILLLVFLRSLAGVLMPLVAVMLGVLWSIGLMQATDEPINILNHLVPVMVLVLGISDSVHLVHRFMEERGKGKSRKDAAEEMAWAMSRACFLTNFTNGIGFASLVTATIATVASFGVYTGIACMLTFLANIALLPVALSYFGPSKAPSRSSVWLENGMEAFARFLIRFKVPLFVGGLAANVAGIAVGAWLIAVDSHLLEEVPPENRVYQATKAVQDRLTPVMEHDVLVEGKTIAGVDCLTDSDCGKEGFSCHREDRVVAALAPYRDAVVKLGVPGGMDVLSKLEERLQSGARQVQGTCVASVKSPRLLNALEEAGKAILDNPETSVHVRRVDSLAAVVRQMHRGMKKDAPGSDRVPDTTEAVSQVLMPLESGAPDLVERYATPDYNTTRLSLFLLDHGSTAWDVVRPAIEKELEQRMDRDPELAERFTHAITGTMTYVEKALSFIISDLMSSIVTAFIPIFLIIALLFRSLRVGFLTIMPNTLPLATTLAFMALAGINLRVSTMIIFSVSLGIAVNDTIHFVARYTEEVRKGLSPEDAIVTTMRHAGPAMLVATTILCAGFLTNLVSEFVALKQFGYLASYTMAMALVGDLFLTVPNILILGGGATNSRIPSPQTGEGNAGGR